MCYSDNLDRTDKEFKRKVIMKKYMIKRVLKCLTPQYFYFELYTRAEQGQFFFCGSFVRSLMLDCQER